MDLNERMMREALIEAERAHALGEVPVGAVIARGDQIIARAHNRTQIDCDPTAHAEVLAIRQAARVMGDWRLTGLTLYVTLEPCPMCAGAIVYARIESLVFGAYDDQAGCAGSVYRITEDPAFSHFARAEGGLLKEECARLLSSAWNRGAQSTKDSPC